MYLMSNTEKNVMYMIIRPITPYILDIFHICAIPNGFGTRTRWREKWLSDTAKTMDIKKGSKILLVVYSEKDDLYYPVRWAEFKNVHNVGGIYRFDFIVEKFVQLNSINQYALEEIKEFSDYFKTKNKQYIGSKLSADDRKSVFINDDFKEINGYLKDKGYEELTAWGNVTNNLSALDEMSNKEFIKIVDCRTLNGDVVEIENGKYNLNSNEFYELRVLQHVYESANPTGVSQHEIKLSCPKEHISILKQNAIIVGKYDHIALKFKTLSFTKEENSYIEVTTNNSDIYNRYSMELPCSINPISKRRTTVCLILSVVFALILVYGSITQKIPDTIIECLRIALIVSAMSASDAINYLTSMSLK